MLKGKDLTGDDKVSVNVFDETGQPVASDPGGSQFAVAIWYPPREGTYKIVVRKEGRAASQAYLVFK